MNDSESGSEAFLPGRKKPDAFILVQCPYTRDTLSSIAGGADPGALRRVDIAQGSWGLLYLIGGAAGFYVPPSESPMATVLRGMSGTRPEEINLEFPEKDLLSIRRDSVSGGKRGPIAALGAFLCRLGLSLGKNRYLVEWKLASGEKGRIDFFLTGREGTFAAALEGHRAFVRNDE